MTSAPPGARNRSTASIVLTRADPDRAAGVSAPSPAPSPGRSWLWWIPLAALVAAAWALLLLGDSLR
jgi:hypothetical protein